MEERTVTIDAERYEELIDTETRVSVARDMIIRDRCIRLTDLLYILGYRGDAEKIDTEQKEEMKKIMGGESRDE